MADMVTYVLGCKVNFADVQAIRESLPLNLREPAALVGTCCVTAAGEKQSRKQVRRAARSLYGAGTVYVTGCAARRDPQSFASLGENVRVLPWGPEQTARWIKDALAGDEAAPKHTRSPASLDAAGTRTAGLTPAVAGAVAPVASPLTGPASRRTRFFLKIQDGCAGGCGYCVIPQVRGRPQSIPAAQVLCHARVAVAAGYPELVVSGINVGAWRDGGRRLPWLMERLAGIAGLKRLRLSSIEVNEVTPRLLEVIAARPLIGRHLHIPLQSGDDAVLKAMGRRYRAAEFRRRLDDARRAIPAINLTTDVIVGFPAEDAAACRRTGAFLLETGFSKAHVFSYSPRPGTAAGALGDPVPAAEKRRRSRELRRLSGELLAAHRRRKLGRLSEVLLESAEDGGVRGGYSSDYTRFLVRGGDAGLMVPVRGQAVTEAGVWGKKE